MPARALLSTPLLLLVGTGTFTSTVRWLELLAVGVFVFDRTGSPLMVALMTIVRMLPMALFGIFVGAIAERFHRLPLLTCGLAIMGFQSIAVGVLAESGQIAVWHLAVTGFVNGMFWSTDFAVRRTLIAEVVPRDRLANAMSLDVLSNNGSRMLGPALGGTLLQFVGLAGTYYLGALGYFIALGAVLSLRHTESAPSYQGSVVVQIVQGLRYLRSERTLTGVLMVTIIFNVFAWPFLSMVPVIGRDVFQLTAAEIGVLASLEGVGVLIAATWLLFKAPPHQFRRIYYYGVGGYLLAALMFAITPWVGAAVIAMLIVGLAAACFSTMQSTLVMLLAEAQARTRMMGVLAVCVGTSPVGLLHLGWLANTIDPQTAIRVVAVEGLVALIAVAFVWPQLRAIQPWPSEEASEADLTAR